MVFMEEESQDGGGKTREVFLTRPYLPRDLPGFFVLIRQYPIPLYPYLLGPISSLGLSLCPPSLLLPPLGI